MDTYERVNACFAADSAIDELGFVLPPHAALDRAGVLHAAHKLGLSFARLAPLAAHAFDTLRVAMATDDAARVHCASRALLLVNADHALALAARRRWLRDAAAERALVDLLQSKHAKAGELWLHRRLLLRTDAVDAAAWQREQAAVERALARYPRCYNAWTHRTWLLQQHCAALPSDARRRHALVAQLRRTAAWCAGRGRRCVAVGLALRAAGFAGFARMWPITVPMRTGRRCCGACCRCSTSAAAVRAPRCCVPSARLSRT